MNFKYRIDNNEVIITGYSDSSSTEINIPEFIDGYPVTSIESNSFCWCDHLTNIKIPNSVVNIDEDIFAYDSKLKFINNIEIKGGFCVINNRHIWFRTNIFKINYQIGGDYCTDTDYLDLKYFINGLRYWTDFNTLNWL